MQIHYKIEFFSYWHASSGLSGGAYADSLVIKDENNLPYLPGRTIKGLLRDSAYRAYYFSNGSLISDSFLRRVFGDQPSPEEMDKETRTHEAEAFFSNANLSDFVKFEIEKGEGIRDHLYNVHASTKIDSKGVAIDRSLRQMEIVVPLTLYGTIESFPDDKSMLDQLEYCMKGVKRLGLNRTRGLGRCRFSIINKPA